MSSFAEFQLQKFLGSGCFGVVWEVIDKSETYSGKHYALKVILVDPENEEKQKRELEISSNIEHTNIVKLNKVSKRKTLKEELEILVPSQEETNCVYLLRAVRRKGLQDVLCLTTELCGETLRQWLKGQHDPRSSKTIVTQNEIVRNIIEGLKYLHETKIIHRDLKPENIMFSQTGHLLPVKIGDYGSARFLKEVQSSPLTSRVGTPLYMAPEADSNEYSFQSDLFSLGLVLWEVLQLIPLNNLANHFDRLVHDREEELMKFNPFFANMKPQLLKLCLKDVNQRSTNVYGIWMSAASRTDFVVSNSSELEQVLSICRDGWRILLKEGEYHLNINTTISKHNVTLKGQNERTILKRGKGEKEGYLLEIAGNNFKLSDIKIEGDSNNSSYFSGILVTGDNCGLYNLTISGVVYGVVTKKKTEINNVHFLNVRNPVSILGNDSSLRKVTIRSCSVGVDIACKRVIMKDLSITDPKECGVIVRDNSEILFENVIVVHIRAVGYVSGIKIVNCPEGVITLNNVRLKGFAGEKECGLFRDKPSRSATIRIGSGSSGCDLGKIVDLSKYELFRPIPNYPKSEIMATALNMNFTVTTQQQNANNSTKTHPEGTVYFVIDTSGSMANSRINQVIASMKTMIAKAPNYLRFSIRIFNIEVKHLVTKKKRYLDIPRLEAAIRKTVGNLTALYDAWGQTLAEIPYKDSKLDLVHVIIFTDGEDNCSKVNNLSNVIEMSKAKIKGENMKLSFIQAGPISEVCTALERLDSSKFMTYNVDNSVAGIEFAFKEVNTVFQQQLVTFQFNVTINTPTNIGDLTSGVGSLALGNASNEVRMMAVAAPRDSYSGQYFGYSGNGNNAEIMMAMPTPHPPTISQRGRPLAAIRPSPSMSLWDKKAQTNVTPKPQAKEHDNRHPFFLKVENIPASATKSELRRHFQQWGNCDVQNLFSAGNDTKIAIISYSTENSQSLATKYSGSSGFRGHFLSLSPI